MFLLVCSPTLFAPPLLDMYHIIYLWYGSRLINHPSFHPSSPTYSVRVYGREAGCTLDRSPVCRRGTQRCTKTHDNAHPLTPKDVNQVLDCTRTETPRRHRESMQTLWRKNRVRNRTQNLAAVLQMAPRCCPHIIQYIFFSASPIKWSIKWY